MVRSLLCFAICAIAVAFPALAAPAAPVTLDLFVASKCPDASRCENRFLPAVLAAVGELVDLRLGFIGALNDSAPFGAECMHGDSECAGNAVQLCAQAHYPTDVDADSKNLPKRHIWTQLLQCVGGFNHTNQSAIPANTDSCLGDLGVPEAILDRVHACASGAEGRALLAASIGRTAAMCGAHSDAPRAGCKSCSMFLDGQRACVVDDGAWYNCSAGLAPDDAVPAVATETAWVREICRRASAKAAANNSSGIVLPLACRILGGASSGSSGGAPPAAPTTAAAAAAATTWRSALPVIRGHSFASTDPAASAAFAQKYFGAEPLGAATTASTPCGASEYSVRLPRFGDFRGGGMELRFAHNPAKPAGDYSPTAFVASMAVLYGNLSDNSGHHWNQFFDDHLGFYVSGDEGLARRLLRDRVPFFTGTSSGLYESVYVVIPGTAKVVELLGDYDAGGSDGEPLPANHVRLSSTQQFCTPKRRRLGGGGGGGGGSHLRGGATVVPIDFGVRYSAGDADVNKTTMAAADPDAAVDFAVRYLGASRVQQHRGAVADGQCAKLAWAQWPGAHSAHGGHQWHVVRTDHADWVSIDHLRPAVPFNVSQLAAHVEGLRDLAADVYDQWLDYRDVFDVPDLASVATALAQDGVPFLLRSSAPDGGSAKSTTTCSLLVDIPRNGKAVEVRSETFTGLEAACAKRAFDLCAKN